MALPQVAEPRVVGLDDWAWRRGHAYGTLVVDLERRRPVALLPDRRAETVAAWLEAHPSVEVVARDRAGAYAEGVRRGAPRAQQVADRWHLLRNLGDALVRVLERHRRDLAAVHAAIEAGGSEATTRPPPAPTPPSTPQPRPEKRADPTHAARQARFKEIKGVPRSGLDPDPDRRGVRARPQDRAPMAARRTPAELGQAGARQHHRALRGLPAPALGRGLPQRRPALAPSRRQSGEMDVVGSITRAGDAGLRCALYQAATVMMHHARPCWLKAWGLQLARRRGMKRAVVARARRIGVILHRMWMDGADFRFARAEALASPA